jgi:hypothetical protein
MTHPQTQILSFCTDALDQVLRLNHTLYVLAKWAFVLAFVLAVVSTAIELWVKWKAAQVPSANAVVIKGIVPVTSDMLKVFTAFLESLAKLPVWFGLFLAGMALVWLATVNVPSVCEPDAAAAPVAPATPAPKSEAPPPK